VDGRIEFRDLKGGLSEAIDVGLRGVRDVIATRGGWLVLGSKLSGNEEKSAIALVGPRQTVEQVWTTPSLFWSIASRDGVHYASDHRGRIYLLKDTGLIDITPSTKQNARTKDQPAQLRFFGTELVRCVMGSSRINESSTGACVRDSGPAVEGFWKNSPIACGRWLVADTQDDVRLTSAWHRIVWDAQTGTVVARAAVARPAAKLSCSADALLLDATAPGSAWKLPVLAKQRASLCSNDAKALAVSSSDVLCVNAAGQVSLRRLREEK
jgi:hypothetical protein